jgi:hypothetical protein
MNVVPFEQVVAELDLQSVLARVTSASSPTGQSERRGCSSKDRQAPSI